MEGGGAQRRPELGKRGLTSFRTRSPPKRPCPSTVSILGTGLLVSKHIVMGPLSLLHPIRWRHVVTTLDLSNDLLALCGDEVCYLLVIFIFRVADDLDRAFTNASRRDICSIVQIHNEMGTLEAGYDVLSFGLFRKGRGPRSE